MMCERMDIYLRMHNMVYYYLLSRDDTLLEPLLGYSGSPPISGLTAITYFKELFL